jgi:predicted acyl esterase
MGLYEMGIPYDKLLRYEKFEGPNLADWCERGYVIVDPDARGAMLSKRDIFS